MAHSYIDPHPPNVLCALCPFFFRSMFHWRQQCVCFQLSKRPLRSYPLPTCPHPHVQLSTNLGKMWVKIKSEHWSEGEEGLGLLPTSPPHNPTLQTFFQVLGVERGLPAVPERFASVNTHKMSIHAPRPYTFSAPSPTPSLRSLQLQLRQFNSGQNQGPLI